MSIDRRTLLKGLALSSAASGLASCRSQQIASRSGALSKTGSTDGICYVNILLHGGFFVAFQPAQIVVRAPTVVMHKYAIGSQGFLTELPIPKPPSTIQAPPADVSVDMDLTT